MTAPTHRADDALTLVGTRVATCSTDIREAVEQASLRRRLGAEILLGVEAGLADEARRLVTVAGARVRTVVLHDGESTPHLLGEIRTPYWAPLGQVDVAVATERCVAGLHANPRAVLAWSGGAELAGEVPMLIDGRRVAATMIDRGAGLFGTSEAVVTRTAALGAERSSKPLPSASAEDWYLVCWLRVLLRGEVWRDGAAPGGTEKGDAAGTVCRKVESSCTQPILAEAERLGLAFAELPGERRLPLAALVIARDPTVERGGRLQALATARRAAALVEKVVVAEASTDPPPAAPSGIEWRQADLHGRGIGAVLGALPTIVIAAGEQLEVADELQMRGVLAELAPGASAYLETPGGREPRITAPNDASGATSISNRTTLRCARLTNLGGAGDWLHLPPRPRGSSRRRFPRFAICAPDYSGGSGGNVALHRLCDLLNAMGCEAWIVPMHPAALTNPDWRERVAGVDGDLPVDAVAVYPEVVAGNPLGARHVVRWLLNRPGQMNGGQPMGERPEDLLVTYSLQVDPDLPVLWIPVVDPTLFFPKDRPGSGRLLWIGKGTVPADLDRSAMTLVTRGWPADKRELAATLRAADVLVSYDSLTALISESLMCATPVLLLGAHEDDDDLDPSRVELSRDGIYWSDDDEALRRARDGALQYHDAYLERCARVEASLEEFLQRVDHHFAPV